MAPEQAAGKSAPITAAVDVYGLGAILYEALTGRPPFAAATVDATLGLVRQDEPVPPRRLQPTVPRDLETICLKCLRKEAGRRYATAQDLADDLRRFEAGEPVRARPVGTTERVIVWCRRKPGFAGLLAALVLVFLAGSSGVLWQWKRARVHAAEAQQNAVAFRRERDTARSEKSRPQNHLRIVRDRVDRLKRMGSDLLQRPGLYRTGQAVLEEALAFYQELLPNEGSDPTVRREAAELFGQVAEIHHTLAQAAKAAEAWGRQASLLTSLLEEEPASKPLEWTCRTPIDGGVTRCATLAMCAKHVRPTTRRLRLQEALSARVSRRAPLPTGARRTPCSTRPVCSRTWPRPTSSSRFTAALWSSTAPPSVPRRKIPSFNAELALALGDQGIFFLETGRGSQAEAAIREAVEIHERVLAGGQLKGSVERYAARNFTNLGRVLVAAGQAREAEQSYRKAVNLLDQSVEESPESVYPRIDLARTLPHLADLLKDLGRWQEAARDPPSCDPRLRNA